MSEDGAGPGAPAGTRASSGDPVSLAEVARRFRVGRASSEELSLAFVRSRLFCPIADAGIRTVGVLGRQLAPMYTSERTLAIGEGPCEWFTGAGSDLLQVVPAGCGIVVDRGSDSEVVLEGWAIHPDGASGQGRGGAPEGI